MKLIKSGVLFCSVLISTLAMKSQAAFGGLNVGNGGAVVRGNCDDVDGSIILTELLDFWEVKHRLGLTIDLGGPLDTVDARLEIAFSRLERVDAQRAALYREWYRTFWSEAIIQEPQLGLPALSDLGSIRPGLPPGCSPVKVIEQRQPESSIIVKRYFVLKLQFDGLDAKTKAGLILHEIIYRDAISRGHPTSMKARIITGFLASDWFDRITTYQYEKLMLENGFVGFMSDWGTPFHRGGVKRFFDEIPMSKADAASFCTHLGGQARLAVWDELTFRLDDSDGQAFRSSAIGKHIFGEDNDGSASYWISDGPQHVDNQSYIPSRVPDSTPLAFLCWQDTVSSPWTN